RGQLGVEQVAEVEALIRNPGAPIALGASNADAALDALIARTPLATNLRIARVIANLEPPGFNVAGTFTVGNASSAQLAKERFEQTLATVDSLSAVGAWFSAQKPIQSHQTTLLDTSVQVSVAAETQIAQSLLAGLNELLPKRAATTP